MEVDLHDKEKSNHPRITIEKGKDYIALIPLDRLSGNKPAKLKKVLQILKTYQVQYNDKLGIT